MTQAIPDELSYLRASLDNLDSALMSLLAERFRVTAKVGRLKAVQGLELVDPEREKQQLARVSELAEKGGLEPDLARRFMRFLQDEAVLRHQLIREGKVL